MLVVDASCVAELILSTPTGATVAGHLRSAAACAAPDLLGVELVSVLSKLAGRGEISARSARDALHAFRSLGIATYDHEPLLDRALALRASLTAYEAVYVALAEGLGADLLTCDAKLARAPGHRARVVLVH